MTARLRYDATAKCLHWATVALLLLQYPLGWLMPGVRRGMSPGTAVTLHLSIGMLVLAVVALRFLWRLTHRVAPAPDLPPWQRHAAEALHWLLYLIAFATTLAGWFYVSNRGWRVDLFGILPLPLLTAPGSTLARTIGQLHGTLIWVLLIAIGGHVAAALAHALFYRDGVLQRMLPGTAPAPPRRKRA